MRNETLFSAMNALSHDNSQERFGESVRASRGALGISQEELAARSKLHRTYVAGVERGIRNPSLNSIIKIAEGLGIPASALFRRMESMGKRVRSRGDVKKA
jgi:transcriptional regulator with XRE-family HTH domain